jgi:hypothetical protein
MGALAVVLAKKCILTLALLLGVDADPRDYGYTVSKEKAARAIRESINQNDELSISILWEYQNLQKKLQNKPRKHMSWFTDIDFSKKNAYDIEGATELDWDYLHKLYPHVKGKTT